MAHKKNITDLTELLLQCVTQPDPMLSTLEWLCPQFKEQNKCKSEGGLWLCMERFWEI